MGKYSDTQRTEAVALCLEIGMNEAHLRTGIPKPTLSRWMTPTERDEMAQRFQTKTQRATQAAALRWQDRRTELLHRLGAIAELAVDKSEGYLNGDDPRRAKDAATTAAIYIDKAQVLSGDATSIVRVPWDPEQVVAEAKDRADALRPRLVSSDGQAV